MNPSISAAAHATHFHSGDSRIPRFKSDPAALVSPATIHTIGAGKPSARQGKAPDFRHNTAGIWSSPSTTRTNLGRQLLANLQFLKVYPKHSPHAKSLVKEIGKVWNCLSEAEKVEILAGIAGLVERRKLSPSVDAPDKGAAVRWLRLTLKTTPAVERNRLLDFLPQKQAKIIKDVVFNKPDPTMVDTLFDHKAFLKANYRIGTVPDAGSKKVLFVGSGLGSTTAAYELMKTGVQVNIVEASDRLGGRLYSRHFQNADGTEAPEFSEMGAMRFPPSGAAFFHYLKVLGIETDPDFPNPGTVPTTLYFKGQPVKWPAGQDAPDHKVLKEVSDEFKQFIETFEKPMDDAREANDRKRMQEIWQGCIDKYNFSSFLSAVTVGLKKLGIVWSQEKIDAFGALGVGTGGFGPLYKASFLEVLRVILNKLETNQHLITTGAGDVIDKFYHAEVERPDGSKASLGKDAVIRLATKVTDISIIDGKPHVTMTGPDGESREKYDAVVVATTPGAMKEMGLSLPSAAGQSPLDSAVASAITDLHMVSSSKVFFRTPTKFWKNNPDIPQVILTDQLQHMLYCLDYPWTDRGVVLGSYTWEDKAIEWTAVPENERPMLLLKAIKKISPKFAEALEYEFGPSLERLDPKDIHSIDWHNEPNYYGAFKFNSPGQEENVHAAYYDFQKGKNGNGVFLAGDSVAYLGGWAHGASETGLHAALGVVDHLDGTVAKGSPLTELNPNLYKYS